jgi:hypothetical protein
MKIILFAITNLYVLAAFAAELPVSGVFKKSCFAVSDDMLSEQIAVHGNEWTLTHTAYEDGACKTPYIHFEIQYRAQGYQQNLDLEVTASSYTALSNEVAETLNLINYCGFADWKKDEKRIVTGLTCDEFTAPKKGEILYTVFDISNEGQRLFLGKEEKGSDGMSEQTRHTTLDPLSYDLIKSLQ